MGNSFYFEHSKIKSLQEAFLHSEILCQSSHIRLWKSQKNMTRTV